ncbi:MAG TPA: glycosyltransferase family 39 protein [Candidatus Binatia bacterium]|jgi:4-amino-4-deoxy-L-arabinose transferase-like glycosyltransferase|nr:glycosyltransferase family 39 protein [Candidatus Binatia bacterium]
MSLLSSRLIATALVLAACAVVLFVGLGSYPLWDPDEGRHAEIAREVLGATDWHGWVTPRLNDEPYREKPIFFYWAVAVAYAAVGVNELGARLVSALAAFATVTAVFAWSLPRWGPRPAALAALVLLTGIEFAGLGRFANLDMLLTLFLTAGVLAVERWGTTKRTTWIVAAATAAAFGMLTKGLVAPLLIGGVGLVHLAVQHRLDLLRSRALVLALAVFVALAAPWHLLAAAIDPAYLRELYLEGHLGRFVGTARAFHHEPFWFYVPILLAGFFPWSALLPATIAATRTDDDDARLCLVWAGIVFLFFSASVSKLGTYILPCFPPLALLTGRALDSLLSPDALPGRAHRLAGWGLWLVVVVLLVLPIVLVVLARWSWDGALTGTSLMALGLLPIGGLLGRLLWRDRIPQAVAMLAASAVLVLVGFYRFAAPPVSLLASTAPLAAVIRERAPDDVPVVAYAIRAPSLLFYLRRPIIHLARWRPLRKLVAGHPLVLVVTSLKHRATIAEAGVTAPWQTGGRRELWGSQPPPDSP